MKTIEVSKEVAEEIHRMNGTILELEAKCKRYEEDNANLVFALREICTMHHWNGGDLIDAQLMAAMAVNPEDYPVESRNAWGLK